MTAPTNWATVLAGARARDVGRLPSCHNSRSSRKTDGDRKVAKSAHAHSVRSGGRTKYVIQRPNIMWMGYVKQNTSPPHMGYLCDRASHRNSAAQDSTTPARTSSCVLLSRQATQVRYPSFGSRDPALQRGDSPRRRRDARSLFGRGGGGGAIGGTPHAPAARPFRAPARALDVSRGAP